MVYLEGQRNPVRADTIKEGDVLQGFGGPATVSRVRSVDKKGLYAPLTNNGKLLVDGIKASSYISLQPTTEYVELQGGVSVMAHHDLAHLFLS